MFYQGLITTENPNASVVEMYTFPLHWHSEIEIIYCLTGQFSAIISDQKYALSAGQTVFIASTEQHEYTSVDPGTSCLLIEMGAGFLKQNFQELAERSFKRPVIDIIPSRIRYLFDTVVAELKHPESAGSEWIITGCLFELAAFMLREISSKTEMSGKRYDRINAMQRMGKLIEHLRINYQQQITIEDAADMTAYEKSNFCKQFKKATQMTFHQYLNMIRIGKACMLLNESDDPVSVVAEKNGFPETKTFNRVFKALMNMTPGEYRKLHFLKN